MTCDEWCEKVGYTTHWLDFGWIDEEFLKRQIQEHLRSQDENFEHYKWAAYRHVLTSQDFSKEQVLDRFVEVMESDPNEHLFVGALSELIFKGFINEDFVAKHKNSRVLKPKSIRKKLGLEEL